MLLGKDKLNTIKVLISKILLESYISHDEFVLVNNVLKEYNEMKEEIKKSWNFRGTHYLSIVDISKQTYEKNGIKAIVDNDGILWFNERQFDGSDHKTLQEITIKYHSDHRRHRH